MDLKELLPQKVTLKLSRLEEPLELRLFTLNDTEWMAEQWPGDELNKIYNEAKVKDILRILVRIIDDESKRMLAKLKIVQIDEDGNENEIPNLNLMEKIARLASEGEIILIINAIFEVRKRSNDVVQSIMNELNQQNNVGQKQVEHEKDVGQNDTHQKKTKKKQSNGK